MLPEEVCAALSRKPPLVTETWGEAVSGLPGSGSVRERAGGITRVPDGNTEAQPGRRQSGAQPRLTQRQGVGETGLGAGNRGPVLVPALSWFPSGAVSHRLRSSLRGHRARPRQGYWRHWVQPCFPTAILLLAPQLHVRNLVTLHPLSSVPLRDLLPAAPPSAPQ